MNVKKIQEIIVALGLCVIHRKTPVDKSVCEVCPYGGDCDAGNRLTTDAIKAVEVLSAHSWRDPVNDPPKSFTPVIVAREYRRGELKVEEGMLTMNGWWKVYGTNVRRIIAWTPMPEAPEKGDLQWLKD